MALEYPPNELDCRNKNEELLEEWKNFLLGKKTFEKKDAYNEFVNDGGFYPYYSSQKSKILYVGWESRGLAGENYLKILHGEYKRNHIDTTHINSHPLHRLLFRMTYGIQNNSEWDDIPKASDLTKDFATAQGISFAFMNFSKFSNETNSRALRRKLVNDFIKLSKNESKNYWNEQIRILDPHIIITMNLRKYWDLNLLGEIKPIDAKNHYYTLKAGNRDIKLIDAMYHFSSSVSPKTVFYEPITNILRGNSQNK